MSLLSQGRGITGAPPPDLALLFCFNTRAITRRRSCGGPARTIGAQLIGKSATRGWPRLGSMVWENRLWDGRDCAARLCAIPAIHRPVLGEDLDIEGAFVSAYAATNQTVNQALQRHSVSFGPLAAAPAHMNSAELSGWMAGAVDRGGHGRILAPCSISHVYRRFC